MLNRSSQWFIPLASDQATHDLQIRFVEFIIRYSRRWKCLSLSHIPAHAMEPFNTLTRHDLPLLEEFHDPGMLRNAFDPVPLPSSGVHAPPFIARVGSLPSLRNLRISLPSGFNISPQFQWGQLTILHVTFASPLESVEFASCLRRLSNLCPLLSECRLSLRYPNPGTGTDEEPSSIESQEWRFLERLNLSLTGGIGGSSVRLASSISSLFGTITVPALTRLSLFVQCSLIEYGLSDIPSAHPSNVDQILQNLIVRSQCELTHLDLSIPSWDNPELTLDVLPSLVALNVDISLSPRSHPNPSNKTSMVRNIAQTLLPAAGSVRCSGLEQFSVTSCSPEDTVILVDLADARARTGIALKSLRAKFGVLSVAGIKSLTSALELAKSKGLSGKIEWEFSRQKPADHFDYPYPLGMGSADTEIISA
ncbi:hypothetical protein V5O48_006564 [Marasmius crinis-equi]|uniref:F-box domain-containing protein n=1 Tax=Marasmius crinis-equi TaxID=585013 RepID=A0ABR3FJ57_9AGAR